MENHEKKEYFLFKINKCKKINIPLMMKFLNKSVLFKSKFNFSLGNFDIFKLTKTRIKIKHLRNIYETNA